MEKIKDGGEPDEDPAGLIEKLDKFLKKIQNKTDVDAGQIIAEKQEKAKESEKPHFYIAPVASDDSKFYSIYITYYKETEMANIRAYMAVNSLKGIAEDILIRRQTLFQIRTVRMLYLSLVSELPFRQRKSHRLLQSL